MKDACATTPTPYPVPPARGKDPVTPPKNPTAHIDSTQQPTKQAKGNLNGMGPAQKGKYK